MILKDGSKMSKSKGNLVAPEEILDVQGADALRLAHLQVKPPQDSVDWEDFGLEGCAKYLARVWRLSIGHPEAFPAGTGEDRQPTEADEEIQTTTHRLIDRVTRDFEKWGLQHRRSSLHGIHQPALPLCKTPPPAPTP